MKITSDLVLFVLTVIIVLIILTAIKGYFGYQQYKIIADHTSQDQFTKYLELRMTIGILAVLLYFYVFFIMNKK
jgi:hypothetical protein